MKLLFILPLFFNVLFTDVNKSSFANKPSPSLYGKWSLISCSGGFTGKGPGWDLGKKILFEYTASGKFKRTEMGKTIETDKFKVKLEKTKFSETPLHVFDFVKLTDQVLEIRNDSLFVYENVSDGFSYVLVRKK